MENEKYYLVLNEEGYNIIISCMNITLEFLTNIPVKNNKLKNKIKNIEMLKNQITY